jgi:PAS domain S-box-containing protein
MIIVNREGTIVLVNSQAEKLFGYPRSELLNQKMEKLLPERFRGQHLHHQTHYFAAPKSRPMGTGAGFEFFGLRKDGSEFPADITLGPLDAKEGTLVSSAIRDITERKQYERVLTEARDAAEAANEAKGLFLMTMSHELRTPMNGILGMTDLVLDTELTDEQREDLGLVRSSAESLMSIISDVLEFSQMDAGKLRLESNPFALRELLSKTLKALSVGARQKGLDFKYEVRPDVPDDVVGDADRIRRILINLVGNAIKFTEQGEVFVQVEEESQEAAVTCLHFLVKDTGIGIPADKRKTIFEPFSQADGAMTRKYGGTGMGLAVCSRLVTAMGGTIIVESQQGQGSAFQFTLRLAMQETPSLRSNRNP